MTNGEAKYHIGRIERLFEFGFRANAKDELILTMIEALTMAIEALEKQIPEKPVESYDGYAEGNPVIEYECPNCGREIDESDHHCPCGKAIDWSDENDD